MHETNLKRFIDLFSQFTKIPKKELKEYLKEEQDIVNLFKTPSSFTSDPLKIKKIQDLNELRVTMNVNANINRKSIESPEDVYNHLIMYGEKTEQEYFLALFLNAKNIIIKTKEINIGTHNASLIDVKTIAKQALMHDSPSIIVAHNHPSGIAKPSNEDIAITKQLYKALKILDIDLLDHIILGDNQFVSLKEQGVFDNFHQISNHVFEKSISYKKLNKGRNVPLAVKEVRQRHKELGKRLENNQGTKEDLQEFKDLQNVIDDFKNTQLKEKSKSTKNQVSKEIKVQSPSFDI